MGDPVDDVKKSANQLVERWGGEFARISKAIEKVLGTYKGRKGELFDQFARIYAITFTQEELQDIVDFYSSPTGQKLAKSNAVTSGTINRIMDVFTSNLSTEFLAAVRAELKAQGIDT